jgi:hypothetical protein
VAIAHGSEILGAVNAPGGGGATNYDTAITPAATPNAVCVIIVGAAATDQITGVTYGISTGAVALTRAPSPYGFATETTEAGGVWIYWSAGTFPTGTQTVRIARTSTQDLRVAISTMTCAVGQTIAVDSGATGTSTSVANPSWTHTSLVNNVVAYLGIWSGLNTMTNTPATNWTLAPTPGFDDMGNFGRGWARRTLATAGSLGAGWTAATADDFRGSSIAFKEVPPPQVVNDPVHAAQAGRQVNPGREAPTLLNP